MDYSNFMNATASLALNLIPEKLQSQPVFLCIDDIMVSKFDRTFENISNSLLYVVRYFSNTIANNL